MISKEILLDDEQFKDCVAFFVEKASEPDEVVNDPQFLKFYKTALDVVAKESAEEIIGKSESPIERMFLGSLLLGSIKNLSYGIVVHPTFKDTNKELSEFQSYLDTFSEFIEFFTKQNGSLDGINDYLDSQVESKKMDSEERSFINRLLFRYVYLPLKDSWHLTLQPKFPDITVNGKSIRPDILLWIPNDSNKKYLIECDGYSFHSNKESFTNDRARDRITQQLGFTTLRFSGSEIHKDIIKVTSEVLDLLDPNSD